MRQRRRFKLTYHGNTKKWLVTDNYRATDDPSYFMTFRFLESAISWIDMNTIKPENQVIE